MAAVLTALPEMASVAVIVQVPAVVDEVYVVDAFPLASVTAVTGLTLPQEAPVMVNITGSAAAAAVPFITVAVTVEVLAPLAGMLVGLAASVIVNAVVGGGLLVWSIVNEPLALDPDSVAVTMQNPTVPLDV
jgi:hypothetical protein